MRLTHLLLAAVLALAISGPTWATAVTYSVVTSGGFTSYYYYLTSDEVGDLITSFHIYAPTSEAAISALSAEPGWLWSVAPDPEGGIDICWYADSTSNSGLASGDRLDVALATSDAIPVLLDYTLPGYLGNWGYETRDWADYGVLVMFDSVPVPGADVAQTPEPTSVIVLGAGCVLLGTWRRRW